jgi:hypothetical protein
MFPQLVGYLGVRLAFEQLLTLFLQYEPLSSLSEEVRHLLRQHDISLEELTHSSRWAEQSRQLRFDLCATRFSELSIAQLTHDVLDLEGLQSPTCAESDDLPTAQHPPAPEFVLGYEIFRLNLEDIPPLFHYSERVAGSGMEALRQQLKQELRSFPTLKHLPLATVHVQDRCLCCRD